MTPSVDTAAPGLGGVLRDFMRSRLLPTKPVACVAASAPRSPEESPAIEPRALANCSTPPADAVIDPSAWPRAPMPALVSAAFFSAEMATGAAPSAPSAPSAPGGAGAALSDANSEPILPSASPTLPDLAAPSALPMRLSAAAADTALASIVTEAPVLPPDCAGTDVLPSAPKASATMTLSVILPLLRMTPLSVVFFCPCPRMVVVVTPARVSSATYV
mmetsp:Transcript_14087/g.33287  ORF Transcript_14087/g.33287 Transcript_14087/m.33287 type:complete len:218 (-) Transcript_14087:1087-1740(-)